MAAFEKLTVSATEASLRESMFGPDPAARAILAFVDGEPAGYATYFLTFASMVGSRGLWLDDIFVVPEFRRRGVGRAIMAHLGDIAVRHRCRRFEWMVLDWNEAAIAFYERLGASIRREWHICRFEAAQFESLSQRSGPMRDGGRDA
jgi:GNAT superfamily N-acetyltransferase